MKAIIPVAGAGTKLRPHTYTQPKALIPLAGKTILSIIVDQLKEAGINEFIFIVGYLGDKIRDYVSEKYPGLAASFVNQNERKGIGHAILLTRPIVGDDEVFIVLGDTICEYDVPEVLSKPVSSLGIKRVNDPRDFGVAEVGDDGFISRVVEKPQIPKSNMALVGIYRIKESGLLYECLESNIRNQVKSRGGHLTHGSPANFSGKNFQAFFYGVKKDTGLVDYDQLEAVTMKEKPKMIICGASAYSRDWDYKRIREVADAVGAVVMADIAHPAGLIATGLLNDPFEHCHIITSTTHKTLRGPRGGIIMLRHDFENPWGLKDPKGNTRTMSQLLDLAVFPGTQGGPLEHVIAAKAVAFGEILDDEFKTYGKQVITNAQKMAAAFVSRGYDLISNGTDNHLMLIDLRNKNISGKKAEQVLGKADITVNKNMVPYDDKSAFVTSGVRIGVPAITTRGMKEQHMETVVEFIDHAIGKAEDEASLEKLAGEVNTFMKQFPLYPELS